MTSRAWTLKSYPEGAPHADNFEIVTSPKPSVHADGDVLVRIVYVTVDPYMRGKMNHGVASYTEGFKIGEVVGGGSVGIVEVSKSDKFPVGKAVLGFGCWQEYHLVNVVKDPSSLTLIPEGVPIQSAMGALGMPGNTAYFGLLDICKPKANETVVVSAAAGAVGLIVAQLAKAQGCRVVGIVSSQEKIDLLVNEYGADAAITYLQSREDFATALRQACPNGIDIYFENVGGWVGTECLKQINAHARIAVCGVVSQYNHSEPDVYDVQRQMLIKKATMKGFIVTQDYASRWMEGITALVGLYKAGKLKIKETIVDGFENIPMAFASLFKSSNTGKMLVKISADN